jgi:putative RNA 2'-phosphotransferase
MDHQRLVHVSKYLSKHLRHEPERLGLELRTGGWVAIDDLLAAAARDRFPISRAELDEVVAGSDKQRFAIDETGTCIRANQGHSALVDLELQPVHPPPVLYHGTGRGSVASILQSGLKKMGRHHVHLSPDTATATKVGTRRGAPVVLAVDAAAMQRDGFSFYCSANGVWLVDHVPVKYLHVTD